MVEVLDLDFESRNKEKKVSIASVLPSTSMWNKVNIEVFSQTIFMSLLKVAEKCRILVGYDYIWVAKIFPDKLKE